MSKQVTTALDSFIQRYLEAAKKQPEMLEIEYDEDWPSDCCAVAGNNGDRVNWQPIKRIQVSNFNDLEKALEMKIHQDIISYYSAYWSDNLSAEADNGYLQLLQPWNQHDFERLQQNLVGHLLMKRRLKQPETLFFALTSEDDFILTLNNTSGEVMLEQVGLPPKEALAPDLATFIHSLQPSIAQP